MTKRLAPDEDDESEYASQMELARLLRIELRKMQKAHLPRYTGRARVRNRISLIVRPSKPDLIEFKVSLDIVERWRALLMHDMSDPPPAIRPDKLEELRLHIVHFKRKGTPLMILRLAEWSPKPYGNKLTKSPKGWQFSARIDARKHGIDPNGGSIKELELVPWPAVKGHIWIVPDSHRAYKARREDTSEFIASLDLEEPPRFKYGVRDPAYVAKLAAEAAERNDK